MFDDSYTMMVIKQLQKDFKNLGFAFRVVSSILYSGYIIYKLIFSRSQYLALDIIMLILTLSYLGFFIYMTHQEIMSEKTKRFNLVTTRVYKSAKFSISFINLSFLIAGIVSAVDKPTTIAIIFAILFGVSFVLQLLIEVILMYATSRIELFTQGVKRDFEVAKKNKMVGMFLNFLAPQKQLSKEIIEEPLEISTKKEGKIEEKERPKKLKIEQKIFQIQHTGIEKEELDSEEDAIFVGEDTLKTKKEKKKVLEEPLTEEPMTKKIETSHKSIFSTFSRKAKRVEVPQKEILSLPPAVQPISLPPLQGEDLLSLMMKKDFVYDQQLEENEDYILVGENVIPEYCFFIPESKKKIKNIYPQKKEKSRNFFSSLFKK